MSDKIEVILGEVAGILPGIGLLLGWISYYFVLSLTPVQEVKVEILEPVYEKVEFAKIPENQEFIGPPPPDAKPTNYRVVYKEIPVLDKDGKPVFRREERTFSGPGNAKVTMSEVTEILVPILKQPPWTYGDVELPSTKPYEDPKPKPSIFSPPPKWARIYKENVQYKGTGVYHVIKNVKFDIGITPDGMAVRFATVASLISLGLVLYKLRRASRS